MLGSTLCSGLSHTSIAMRSVGSVWRVSLAFEASLLLYPAIPHHGVCIRARLLLYIEMSDPVTDVWYWAPFTDEDHSGEGWIFGITALIVVCIVTSLRLFLRRGVYGLDDAFIGSSLVRHFSKGHGRIADEAVDCLSCPACIALLCIATWAR